MVKNMNLLKQMRRFWELSQKDPKAIELLTQLKPEELKYIPPAPDGRAEYLGEGTEEEFEDMKKEDSGMKAWYDRLKQL